MTWNKHEFKDSGYSRSSLPAKLGGDSLEGPRNCMTYEQIRAMYQLREKLIDCQRLMSRSGYEEYRDKAGDVIKTLDADLEDYVEQFRYDNPARISGDILAVLFSCMREERSGSLGHLLVACGLSSIRKRTPGEAGRMLKKSLESAAHIGKSIDGEISDWVIGDLSVKSGLHKEGVTKTTAGVIDWLSRNRSDKFLSGMTARLGSMLADGKGEYSDAYRNEMASLARRNEEGSLR
jgi:hypothetical protein